VGNEIRIRLDYPLLDSNNWKIMVVYRVSIEKRVLEFKLDIIDRAFVTGIENIILRVSYRWALYNRRSTI
jgi:hypothetical protein